LWHCASVYLPDVHFINFIAVIMRTKHFDAQLGPEGTACL
jgi:hypothetical protein